MRARRASVDAVVGHFAPHVFPVLDLLGRKPLIEHFHGPWSLEARAAGLPRPTVLFRAVQERIVYGRADRIIVLSQYFGDLLESEFAVPRKRIRVVPGGADLDRFYPASTRAIERRRLGIEGDRPLLVCCARLESQKGVAGLIDAMRTVRPIVPHVSLAVLGTGSQRTALEKQAADSGLRDCVRFLGHADPAMVAAYFRAADFTVVPSTGTEGFGLVCIESLACGTPVLATPVGALPEVLRPLSPHTIAEGTSADAIARSIGDALTGRVAMPSPEACVAYARRFSWTSVARSVLDVYHEVA